jgi:hypothetical protein
MLEVVGEEILFADLILGGDRPASRGQGLLERGRRAGADHPGGFVTNAAEPMGAVTGETVGVARTEHAAFLIHRDLQLS